MKESILCGLWKRLVLVPALCVGAGLAVEDSLAGIPALGLKFQCSWQGTPNLIFNNKLKEFKRVLSL